MISLMKPSQVVAMIFSDLKLWFGHSHGRKLLQNFPIKMNFCQWKKPVTSFRFYSDGNSVNLKFTYLTEKHLVEACLVQLCEDC